MALVSLFFACAGPVQSRSEPANSTPKKTVSEELDEVLVWNATMIEADLAVNLPDPASPRIGAIVHVSVFDSLNGIERGFTPYFVNRLESHSGSARAAVVQAAYA